MSKIKTELERETKEGRAEASPTEQLAAEIVHHGDNALESFKTGQEIHRNYLEAPEKYNLSDEVERFSSQLQAGIDAMHQALKLQDER